MRRRGIATFVLLLLVADVVGDGATSRIDRALHVAPLAPSSASYYPFLLAGAKIVAALVLAALLARLMRGRAAAEAGHRVLGRKTRAPRLNFGLSPRIWALSFAATSLIFLVHVDAERIAVGRWPLFAPWLHTYALPVYAALAVVVALAWSLARWVHEVEDYGKRTLERARLILNAALRPARGRRRLRPVDDHGPRRRFGLAFESRPPPLPA
jgi:hypothetical protein